MNLRGSLRAQEELGERRGGVIKMQCFYVELSKKDYEGCWKKFLTYTGDFVIFFSWQGSHAITGSRIFLKHQLQHQYRGARRANTVERCRHQLLLRPETVCPIYFCHLWVHHWVGWPLGAKELFVFPPDVLECERTVGLCSAAFHGDPSKSSSLETPPGLRAMMSYVKAMK